MAEMNPELRAAIETAKARVKVDSYYTKAMNAGLKGNAQGFWSGSLMGLATGGMAGTLISLAVSVAIPGSALIGWPLVLGIASLGGTAGGVTGARIGAGSGAIAGVAAERERRDKAEKLEQEILASPAKQLEAIAAYRANPVVEKDDTAAEIYATSRKGEAFGKLVDWKTMAMTVAICAVFSMALFGGAFLLAGGPLLGMAAGNGIASGLGALGMSSIGAALGIGAAAGAATGITYGITYPPIFAGLTQKTADLLSQKMVRGQTGFEHIKTVDEMQQEAVQNRAVSDALKPATRLPMVKSAASEVPLTQVTSVAALDRIAESQQQRIA